MENKAVTLCELLGQVKTALKNNLPFSWWVVAEISELKVNYSGHCYLELIEKNENNESIRAKVRATIWATTFRMIQPYFETTTQMELTAGIKVMLKVSPEFHELYGLSLNITDIEPSFTIGEMARQKLEIIKKLKDEGVFEMNKSLSLTELPRRIAVISSMTAAGMGDFTDQLLRNTYGYKFYLRLFPAVMQGDDAEKSIITALDRIYKFEHCFDVVVIIRGGGAQSDLNCFNNYWLNYHICQFPLPVLTGIGHEQDETIADMVAHTRLKTPTAVAEFLIGCFRQTEEEINDRIIRLSDIVNDKVHVENERLNRFIMMLKPVVKERLTLSAGKLKHLSIELNGSVRNLLIQHSGSMKSRQFHLNTSIKEYVNNEKHRLELLEKKNGYLDPFLILKRGYSITYYKGKAVKNPNQVPSDEEIETKVAEGFFKSKKV